MIFGTRKLTGALTISAAMSVAGIASAQPLNILVNALALPGAILSAPFAIFTPPAPNAYNPAPARAAAIGYTDDLFAIVPPETLRQTGPSYASPAGSRGLLVLRAGSTVPSYVTTAPLENVSVPGLMPGHRYEFFVSSEQRVVVIEPSSRRVVRVL